MDWLSLYIIYIYLSLFFIAYGPPNKNILHGFPRSIEEQQGRWERTHKDVDDIEAYIEGQCW